MLLGNRLVMEVEIYLQSRVAQCSTDLCLKQPHQEVLPKATQWNRHHSQLTLVKETNLHCQFGSIKVEGMSLQFVFHL